MWNTSSPANHSRPTAKPSPDPALPFLDPSQRLHDSPRAHRVSSFETRLSPLPPRVTWFNVLQRPPILPEPRQPISNPGSEISRSWRAISSRGSGISPDRQSISLDGPGISRAYAVGQSLTCSLVRKNEHLCVPPPHRVTAHAALRFMRQHTPGESLPEVLRIHWVLFLPQTKQRRCTPAKRERALRPTSVHWRCPAVAISHSCLILQIFHEHHYGPRL